MHLIRASLFVTSLFLVVIYPSRGYIINEDGQLVPFKIYKKGNHGARLMCFLHPRNCRGGFHKRLTEGPNEQETEDIYDLHVNKRNQKTNRNVDETVRAKQRFDYDDNDIFDPGFNSEEIEKDVTSFTPAELRLLKEYNNKFLSEFPETVQSETERRAPNSRFHKTLSFASKQSRNSNDIRDPFVLKEDLLPKDLDFRYSQSWPEYSSDSSLSLDLPTGIKHREPYSYLSDDIPGVDGPKHGNRKFLTGYDVTAYHKFNPKGSR